jgi:glutathione reductase (NADPH)
MAMTDFDYDLFVIGAGSGGVRAARMASSYGARVGICENFKVGGTCVVRGCIPKKLFVYASHVTEDHATAKGYGWSGEAPTFSWPTLLANKDKEIDRLNGLYKQTLSNNNVDLFEKKGVMIDAHTIDLEGQTVTADKVLVATGGWPSMPDIPGIEHVISSNEAFHLETWPEQVIIVGGGYIAVEFAGIFNGLGVQTTQLYRKDQILRGFDVDVRNSVATEMRKKGVDIQVNTDIASIEKTADGLVATLRDGGTLQADVIMYATGRVPSTGGMGLEALGVAMRDNGAIIVDENYRTSVDNIFSLGDCIDRMQLTPVAIAEAMAFTATQFNNVPTPMDYENVATAVFSQPPVGTVGLTEEEARAKYGEIVIFKSDFRPLLHTLGGSEERTMMKLIVDKASDRVVGVHMVGMDAGEIIQGIGVAVKCGATKAQFDATMAIHPTAAEEFVTMRDPVS